jgi:hypothetical protein
MLLLCHLNLHSIGSGTSACPRPKRVAKPNTAQPSTKRVRDLRTRPKEAIVTRSQKQTTQQKPATEAPTRPSAIVGLISQQVTSVVVSTLTPLDCIGLPISMAPFDNWPDMALNVNMNLNIVITPVITPSDSQLVAAEWSSRFELPVPVREDTVELRQRSPVQEIVLPSSRNDSCDDDDVPDAEQYNWHILESAMRK